MLPAPISPPRPLRRTKRQPPSYTDKTVVETPVPTGFVLTAVVARSWHFRSQREMRRFRDAEGLFA